MRKDLSISAFFPCYNDGGTIASMVIGTMVVLEDLTDDYEIIVIDDGSKGNSSIKTSIVKSLEKIRFIQGVITSHTCVAPRLVIAAY